MHGQKGFNGVAILSKRPFDEVVVKGLPGDDDDAHARYIEVLVPRAGGVVRIGNLYLPNGNPIGTDKFAYKLAWMKRLQRARARAARAGGAAGAARRLQRHPRAGRRQEPDAWREDALFQPETRAAFRTLLNLGLTDAVRACHPGPGIYTFWDYQAGAWQKNHGIRIDHILLSPQAADRLQSAPASTSSRAAGRSRPTTCRCGWN